MGCPKVPVDILPQSWTTMSISENKNKGRSKNIDAKNMSTTGLCADVHSQPSATTGTLHLTNPYMCAVQRDHLGGATYSTWATHSNWAGLLLTAVSCEASVDVLTASRARNEAAHYHVQDGHQQYEEQHHLDLREESRLAQ